MDADPGPGAPDPESPGRAEDSAAGPEPGQALLADRDAFGIRSQRSFDYEHTVGNLQDTRNVLANKKVVYQVASRVGLEGVHPEQVRKEIAKLERQAGLLESFLLQGALPGPTSLEVVGSGIEVPKARKGRAQPPPPDVA